MERIIFDAHCDTMSELLNQDKQLLKNDMQIDMQRLSKYESYTQVFAAFIDPEYKDNAMERVSAIIDKFYCETEKNDITVCKSYADWKSAKTRVKAFLSIEGGEPINSISDLHHLYDLGVRIAALTWNFKNKIACGVCEKEDSGLSDFGREVISEMNKIGMTLDVSHLSEKSFWQAANLTKKPIVATHSNSLEVMKHIRNLSDEQFLKIKETGGVVGINFYPPFLGSDISYIQKHIEHFLKLGGENNIGLGSDFDGVDSLPSGINGVQDMQKVLDSLDFSDELKEKIAYKNFLRVIKEQ